MTDDRTDYIRGLHELADYLHAHPDAPLPMARLLTPLHSNIRVADFSFQTGAPVPTADKEGNLSVTLRFGAVEYHVYGYTDWDQHKRDHDENTARGWAAKNGHQLIPANAQEPQS